MTYIVPLQKEPTPRQIGDIGCTLSEYVNEYIRGRVKRAELLPATGRTHSYTLWSLAESFGKRPLNQFNRKAIERWMETHNQRLSPAYRRLRQTTVKGFTAWMLAEGHIKTDPCLTLPAVRVPRGVPKTFQHDEVARLLAEVADDTRATAIVWLMVGVGCRCIEVSRLDVGDYDARSKMLRITGKGGHERVLPVPDAACRALNAYLDEAGWIAGPLIRRRYQTSLFGYPEGAHFGRLKAETLSIYVQKWCRDAGVKARMWDGRSAHGLRRTGASDVMDATGDIRVVKEMLGHAKLETTAVYLRPVALDKMREAMEGREYKADPPPLRAVAGD